MAAVSLLAVFTSLHHDWIERAFGVDLDSGDGSVEWVLVLVPALIAVLCVIVAYRKLSKARVVLARSQAADEANQKAS